MNADKMIALARSVIESEAQAVSGLQALIDANFSAACRLMLECRGRVIVTGMGKSGHIGNKIASTLASTGTAAFFVHPGEASHGDLGMITGQDVVLALSNSGETDEILVILPLIKRLGIPLIVMTGQPSSTLAREATICINLGNPKEACPLNLAPTSSTTAALAMGDALAIVLLESRAFTAEDFARAHPGGSLGRRLLLRARDLMHAGERVPMVGTGATLDEALAEMTRKGLGMTAIVDDHQKVLGIYTDGDIRRTLGKSLDPHRTRISEVMTRNCITVKADMLAAEAVNLMQEKRINGLLVTDDSGKLLGALNMMDMLRARIL
ncbi:MAG TPA: KpsF/GutQ family sugar-phosphate isomerase [Gammaproteobacteria bacterium]|nr:KpsF/GutQ family sugar-phosphate isomerase [Gammaproteobacteria bacterium]